MFISKVRHKPAFLWQRWEEQYVVLQVMPATSLATVLAQKVTCVPTNRDSKIKFTFSVCSHASHLYCYSADTKSDLSTNSSDSKISYISPGDQTWNIGDILTHLVVLGNSLGFDTHTALFSCWTVQQANRKVWVELNLKRDKNMALNIATVAKQLVSNSNTSPWYNHTGWLGINHQFTCV